MIMKSPFLYGLLLSSLILFSCKKEETSQTLPAKGESIPVRIRTIQSGTLGEGIPASGNFLTKDETVLSFKVGGIITKILVQEGDAVKKGQVLATLDLTEINTGLAQARLAFEKAERDYLRAKNLYRDSVATLEQFQNSETALEIAEQQLKAAEFNRTYAEIRAPQSGYVLRKFANPGQLVGSGTPILQVNGANQDNWTLQVSVNDQNWSRVFAGDTASIHLENLDKDIPAKVIRKSQSSDPVTGAFWIELQPNQLDGIEVASGLFARATIFPKEKIQGWEIPYEAVLDAQGDYGYVFVTEDQQTAKKVRVRLGKLSAENVQVLEGLEQYPSLIVSGSAYLKEGSTITISQDENL